MSADDHDDDNDNDRLWLSASFSFANKNVVRPAAASAGRFAKPRPAG